MYEHVRMGSDVVASFGFGEAEAEAAAAVMDNLPRLLLCNLLRELKAPLPPSPSPTMSVSEGGWAGGQPGRRGLD